jgi:hypothetical protein
MGRKNKNCLLPMGPGACFYIHNLLPMGWITVYFLGLCTKRNRAKVPVGCFVGPRACETRIYQKLDRIKDTVFDGWYGACVGLDGVPLMISRRPRIEPQRRIPVYTPYIFCIPAPLTPLCASSIHFRSRSPARAHISQLISLVCCKMNVVVRIRRIRHPYL